MTRYLRIFATCIALALAGSCDDDSAPEPQIPEGKRPILLKVDYEALSSRVVQEVQPYDYWGINDQLRLGYMTDTRTSGVASCISLDNHTACFIVEADYAAQQLFAYFTSNSGVAYNRTMTFDIPTTQRKTSHDDYGDARRYMEFYTRPVSLTPDTEEVTAVACPTGSMLRLMIYDSRNPGVKEAIQRVDFESFFAEPIAGNLSCDLTTGEVTKLSTTGTRVSVVWDPISDADLLTVPGSKEQAQMIGMVVLPTDRVSGTFSVVTDQYTYTFPVTEAMRFDAGYERTIWLDLAEADWREVCYVGVLGDSISTFLGYISSEYGAYYPAGDVTEVSDTYWYKLIYEYMTNGELDINSSFAGTRVTTDPKYPGYDFVSRCCDFIHPDVVLIHGGTNDTNNSVPLGAYDYDLPVESLNPDEFRPAYIKLIRTMQERYEGVQLICIVGDRLGENYARSVVEIADHFGLPCVNFYGDGDNIPKYSGSHPTAEGFSYMARKIYEQTKEYLR